MFNVVKADVLFKFVIRKAEREAETGMEQWSSSGWEDCCRCAVSDMPEVKGNDPVGKTDCCRCAVPDMPEVKGNDPVGRTAVGVLFRICRKTREMTQLGRLL